MTVGYAERNPFKTMNPKKRAALRRILFLPLISFLESLPDQTPGPGKVRGRLHSSSRGSHLNRARGTLKRTSLETFTDSSDSFVLTRMPAGPTEISAAPTGLLPRNGTVTAAVAAGGSATLNFDLSGHSSPVSFAVKVLDPFSVEAERPSVQAIALSDIRDRTQKYLRHEMRCKKTNLPDS